MATYSELYDLHDDPNLLQKIEVACWVAAESIRTEAIAVPNHANRLIWAKIVLEDPEDMALSILPALLAQNKSAPVTAITNAADVAIQTAVDNVVDVFATG
jgi:hypothetical protein